MILDRWLSGVEATPILPSNPSNTTPRKPEYRSRNCGSRGRCCGYFRVLLFSYTNNTCFLPNQSFLADTPAQRIGSFKISGSEGCFHRFTNEKNSFVSIKEYMFSYNAGACLPFREPFGCFKQLAETIELMVPKLCPQYLQVYFGFSLPS
ncbi:MAG: hypothetical protein PHT69_12735 [Bacteroidales bacterium]|nr:hypothetical protein [Bacteroidales bacterium]